jgi:hypothetical protein
MIVQGAFPFLLFIAGSTAAALLKLLKKEPAPFLIQTLPFYSCKSAY